MLNQTYTLHTKKPIQLNQWNKSTRKNKKKEPKMSSQKNDLRETEKEIEESQKKK